MDNLNSLISFGKRFINSFGNPENQRTLLQNQRILTCSLAALCTIGTALIKRNIPLAAFIGVITYYTTDMVIKKIISLRDEWLRNDDPFDFSKFENELQSRIAKLENDTYKLNSDVTEKRNNFDLMMSNVEVENLPRKEFNVYLMGYNALTRLHQGNPENQGEIDKAWDRLKSFVSKHPEFASEMPVKYIISDR
ncbi:MAG: hypothetical protein Tsb0021_03760 [Chlamydiales bacterium]